MRTLIRRLLALFSRRTTRDEDLAAEIRQHLEEKADELVARGLSQADAHAAARRAFGNPTLVAEVAREAWGRRWFDDLVADLRYGARQFRRTPVVAAACVLTLGFGIGATAAIFTIVDDVVLRPLPFHQADRLVLVSETRPGNVERTGAPLTRFRERAALGDIFARSGAYWDVSGGDGMVFDDAGNADRVQFSVVTADLFPMLGIEPARGRGFAKGEDAAGNGSRVFLISDALWRTRLGGDTTAIGRTYRLDGDPYQLIGVMPAGFVFPGRCDLWLPVGSLDAWITRDRASHQFWMIGQLRGGVSVDRARRALEVVRARVAELNPASDGDWRVTARPLMDELVGSVRATLWLTFGAVGLVLLIACANVTGLLVARAIARGRELKLRAVLGASRTRLARQALAESFLLAVAGAALALVLADLGLHAILTIGAGSLPRLEAPRVSGVTIAFTGGLVILVTLVVGIAPGLHAGRMGFAAALREGQRGSHGSRRMTMFRNALVVGEVALTMMLVVGSGLMVRSFARLRTVHPGFNTSRVTTARVALPDATYPRAAQRTAFLTELLRRINAEPGIESAAAIDRLPLGGEGNWNGVNVVGRPALDAAHAPIVESRAVSVNYLATMGVRLLAGRPLTDANAQNGRRVAIVNETMAHQFWPTGDAVGARLASPYSPNDTIEVIGVASDVKDVALDRTSPPEMYVPYTWWSVMNIVMRGPLDADAAGAIVRRDVRALDPGVAVYATARLNDVVGRSIARPRLELGLFALFAALALVLASIGLYGLLAFSVGQRQQEIGVRIALGAQPWGVMKLVLGQGMRFVVAGVLLGGVASLAATRVMRALLFELRPTDPVTFVLVAALLTVVGAMACWIPARRAARVDPVVAFKNV